MIIPEPCWGQPDGAAHTTHVRRLHTKYGDWRHCAELALHCELTLRFGCDGNLQAIDHWCAQHGSPTCCLSSDCLQAPECPRACSLLRNNLATVSPFTLCACKKVCG